MHINDTVIRSTINKSLMVTSDKYKLNTYNKDDVDLTSSLKTNAGLFGL